MADSEIPDLTDGGAATTGDLVHVVRGPNSRKATLGDAAGKSVGTGAGSVAAGDDSRITGALAASVLTTRGDIIYRGASVPERLAKGTVGQMLEMGANDPLWAAPAGMKLLASGTISAAAVLDIPLTSFSGYRGFLITLAGLIPATDGATLFMRFSSDGGSSFAASGYNYTGIGSNDAGASAVVASGSAAQIPLSGGSGVGNASTKGADSEILLLNPQSTARWTKAHFRTFLIDSSGNAYLVTAGGSQETAQDTDAIRVLYSSGNISSGGYALYGLV